MGWESTLKKAKFQGPPRQHAKFQADEMNLGMALRAIHQWVKNTMEHLEKATSDDEVVDGMRHSFWLKQAKVSLDHAMEEIDKIDEQMLERSKYVGRKEQTYKFRDRVDEDDLDYEGAKFPRNR